MPQTLLIALTDDFAANPLIVPRWGNLSSAIE
jgi:hypothetical protein